MYKETLISRLASGLEGEELDLFTEAAALCEATEDMSLAEVLMTLREGGAELAKAILSESIEEDDEDEIVEDDDFEFEEEEVIENDDDFEFEEESFDEEDLEEDTSNTSANPDRIRPVDAHNPQDVIYRVHSRKKNKVKESVDQTVYDENKNTKNESYSETIMDRLKEIGKIDEKYQSIEDKAISIEEDVTAMFEGIELTEDFKEKASLIFEAAVARQVNAYKELVNEAIDDVVEEEVAAVTEELTEKMDKYLDYVVEEWVKENELAIETGLRVEIAEDFIKGLKGLFTEHYIEVPEGKENILDTVVAEKEGLEEEFEKTVQKNIELSEEIKELKKGVIISEMTRDLADTEAEKLEELVDTIEYTDADDFMSKVGQIKESYFNRAPKTSPKVIDESEIVTEEVIKEEVINDPKMASYVDGIAKFIK